LHCSPFGCPQLALQKWTQCGRCAWSNSDTPAEYSQSESKLALLIIDKWSLRKRLFRCRRRLASQYIQANREYVFGGANGINRIYIDRGLTVDGL
jgi:hypothetical protein